MFDYEKFYETQDANFLSHPERHGLVASLCKGHVADIGCCMGILADYYQGEYTGFDIAKSALDKARTVRRKDANFIEFDCSDLRVLGSNNIGTDSGVEIEKFDTFVLAEYIEHFADDKNFIDPILKRAKIGSRIIITTPNGDRIPDPSHLCALTIPDLRKRFAPYGRVKFYNWPGAFGQIVMTCDIGIKNDNLLSLVMVVKNEAVGLEKAILSAIDHVDNIVIAVDNSTTDQTVKIAKRYADTVKMFTWSDDFSAARNYAHEGVTSKYILFLDGHEYVKECPNLRKYLFSDAGGFLCSVEMDDGSIIRNPRIYKTGTEFVGKIHEQQQCKSVLPYSQFIVKHDRLNSQSASSTFARSLQSDDMVPRIMGQQLKENPRNIRAAFHLGLHAQARSKFKNAIKYYKKYLKYSTVKSERWFILFQMAHCQFALQRPFRAFRALLKAEKETPNRWEVKKMRGIINFYLKRYVPAIEYFVESLELDPIDYVYKPWPIDHGSTFNIIGECKFQLGDYWKANVAFQRAFELTKDNNFKKLFKKRADLMLKMAEQK